MAEGYRYTGIESSINSVEVVGLKSDLAGINSITIPKTELNMDGADSDRKVNIDLKQYLTFLSCKRYSVRQKDTAIQGLSPALTRWK